MQVNGTMLNQDYQNTNSTLRGSCPLGEIDLLYMNVTRLSIIFNLLRKIRLKSQAYTNY